MLLLFWVGSRWRDDDRAGRARPRTPRVARRSAPAPARRMAGAAVRWSSSRRCGRCYAAYLDRSARNARLGAWQRRRRRTGWTLEDAPADRLAPDLSGAPRRAFRRPFARANASSRCTSRTTATSAGARKLVTSTNVMSCRSNRCGPMSASCAGRTSSARSRSAPGRRELSLGGRSACWYGTGSGSYGHETRPTRISPRCFWRSRQADGPRRRAAAIIVYTPYDEEPERRRTRCGSSPRHDAVDRCRARRGVEPGRARGAEPATEPR